MSGSLRALIVFAICLFPVPFSPDIKAFKLLFIILCMLSKIGLVLLVLSIKGILKLNEVLSFELSFSFKYSILLIKSLSKKGFLIISIPILSYSKNVSISNFPPVIIIKGTLCFKFLISL